MDFSLLLFDSGEVSTREFWIFFGKVQILKRKDEIEVSSKHTAKHRRAFERSRPTRRQFLSKFSYKNVLRFERSTDAWSALSRRGVWKNWRKVHRIPSKDLRKHRLRVYGKVRDMRTDAKASRKSFSGPARKRLLSPKNFNNTADKKVEFNFSA